MSHGQFFAQLNRSRSHTTALPNRHRHMQNQEYWGCLNTLQNVQPALTLLEICAHTLSFLCHEMRAVSATVCRAWDAAFRVGGDTHRPLGLAFFATRIKLMRWARARDCPRTAHTCAVIAGVGHLKVLQWARKQGYFWGRETCTAAARNDRRRVIQRARELWEWMAAR